MLSKAFFAGAKDFECSGPALSGGASASHSHYTHYVFVTLVMSGRADRGYDQSK